MASSSWPCISIILITFKLCFCGVFNGFQWIEFYGEETSLQAELTSWSIMTVAGVTTEYTFCDIVPFAAGFGVMEPNNGIASRIYSSLPPHNVLYFSINFLFLDYWNGTDYLSLKFDSVELGFQNFVTDSTAFSTNQCNEVNRRGFQTLLIGIVPHSGPDVTLQIISHLNGPPTEKSFGFREISLIFANVSFTPPPQMCAYPTIALLNNYVCPCVTYNPARYQASDGSCSLCDPACRTCIGPSASECVQCQGGYNFDGTKCVLCDSECVVCNKEAQGCLYCYPPKVMFEGSCIDECGPMTVLGTPYLHCSYQCSAGQFLYPDGSCQSICAFPMTATIKYSTKKFCESPCLSTETLFYDGSCATTTCSTPLILKNYGSYQVCELPCNPSESLFDDGLCHPSSLCQPPFVSTIYGSVGVCTGSCTSPLILAWDLTCKSSCPVPFIQQNVGVIQVCRLPNCGVNSCQVCNFDSDCPQTYYCYKTTAQGICMSYISYTLNSQLVKTIMNGYVIRVQVTPLQGIPDSADSNTLIVTSSSLQENSEYKVTSIQVVSKGVFLVTLNLLQSIDVDPLPVQFTYSPANLNLHSQIYLPFVAYISPAIQKAAEMAQTNSYVSFGILSISILGYVMTGGLSALWSFLPENQYCYYLLYLNVAYPYHSKLYFRSLSNYNLIFTADTIDPASIDKEVKRSLPERFVDEGYSTDFIQNTGQTIALIFGILIALLLVAILFKALALPRRSYLVHRLLKTIRRILRWNGLVRQLFAYSLPLTLASFVQFHISIFGSNSSGIAAILAGAILFIIVLGFKKTFRIIKRIPSDSFERMVYSEWYGTLWEGLDLDINSTRFYYWMTSIRGVVLAYVSVFFEVYSYLQIMILICYQCAVISLFIKNYRLCKIFESKSLNIVTFMEEILILLIKIAILSFEVMDVVSRNSELIVIMGWAIIAPGILNQIVQSIYSICSQIAQRKKIMSKIKEAVRDLCKKKSQHKTKIKRTIARPIKVRNIRVSQDSDLEVLG